MSDFVYTGWPKKQATNLCPYLRQLLTDTDADIDTEFYYTLACGWAAE